MKRVLATIKATGAVITDSAVWYEGETFKKAVGLAILGLHDQYTSQYVKPVMYIDSVQLTNTMCDLIRGNYWKLQENFEVIRENLLPLYAMKSEAEKIEYIRSVDVNGYFKTQKTFSNELLGSVVVEQLRKVKFAVTLNKLDAAKAVWTPEQKAIKDAVDKVNKDNRLAAKKVKELAAAKLKEIAAKVTTPKPPTTKKTNPKKTTTPTK